ncbi:MAG TPA: TonB-dependent receptor [Blastocatellia bacterium]|nr:TonB-dependent receptor [Blastocatellia bacterium]
MNGRQLLFRALSLLLCAHLAATGGAIGQTRKPAGESSLRVTVLDPTRAVIVAARVSIKPAGGPQKPLETNGQGDVYFASVSSGLCKIRVEARGFEPREVDDFVLKPGVNTIEVLLEVEKVRDEVQVTEDARDRKLDRNSPAFTTILTEQQIAELPDDPEEFAEVLRQMAGPGAVFRVNGFSGGRFPPKSQIREIRFRLNAYAAENHESGFVTVDIYTKPGGDLWHGSVNFGFRDRALNARNFFAPIHGPEQYRRGGFTLDGPIWPGHTSLFLYGDSSLAYDSKTIVAALPDGRFSGVVTRPLRKLDLSARVEHTLTKTHTLRAEYQRNAFGQDNLGVGNFDLPERAYSVDSAEHVFRLSDTGLLTRRFVNEFRLQARWREVESHSATQAPAILVLNAFNRGGAQVQGSRRVREIEIADNLDYAIEGHSMRTGFALQLGSYSSDELANANGTFTFSSLASFAAGRPTTFSRRVGDPHVDFGQRQFGWYFQDDFRVAKGLSLSLGLRYEMQTNLSDRNNFAPRLGLAWSPFRDGKTTIRAGAGIFYDWFSAETYEQTLRVDGLRQHDMVVLAPGFPDPFASGIARVLPPSRIQRDPRLRTPYIESASLGVEREISLRFHLRAVYFYQRGVHELRGHNVNAPARGLGRPNPALGNVNQIESTANSTLHLLNVNVSDFSKRVNWLVNYTLSRSINESDGPLRLPADNNNLRGERGPAAGDARHRLFAMVNVGLFKGVRLGTLFHFNSATPYNITTGRDDNLDSVSNDRPPGIGRNSARGDSDFDLSTRLSWGFGFGQQTRRSTEVNKRVTRVGSDSDAVGGRGAEAIDKRWRFQLYLQVHNILNHPNLINFSGVQTSPFFGRPTAAMPGRWIETGIRFSF